MATSIDGAPIYDPLTKNSYDYLNDIWMSWLTNFIDTLNGYLSPFGMFVPQLTTSDRDSIQSPVEGQMIYNTTTLSPQIWRNGQWRTFTTTP